MNRFLTLLLAGCLAQFAPQAAAELTPPDKLVKEVTLEVLEIVSKDREIQAGNVQKVIGLVEEKVLPHFSFESMTALAMGLSWRQTTPEQKQRLTQQFKTLLVRTYASALTTYRDEQFEFMPLRAKPTDTDVTVNVKVLKSGRQPIAIDYDMEKTPRGWKCYNVYVGGVSLVLTYRTEFAAEVRKSGVDGLIGVLEKKNKQLAAGTT
ncbi:MAG TPA: ABC transporter substrate-binding protein [Burkholderiales bacterium]|nr:ABC transporter substrate-binding protein [Burkholderiales bacterium]